jgi:hypothetical protein
LRSRNVRPDGIPPHTSKGNGGNEVRSGQAASLLSCSVLSQCLGSAVMSCCPISCRMVPSFGCQRLTARRWCLGLPCMRRGRPAWRQAACRCACTRCTHTAVHAVVLCQGTAASILMCKDTALQAHRRAIILMCMQYRCASILRASILLHTDPLPC